VAAVVGLRSKLTALSEATTTSALTIAASEMIIQHEDNPALTVTTAHEPKCYGESTGWRIRKLTPVETGRLMGLHDDEIQKMYDAGIPKTQLYKLHGNSIVINVLQEIFRKMFIEKQNESRQLELF